LEKSELKVVPYLLNLAMNFDLQAVILTVNWNEKHKPERFCFNLR